VPALQPALRAGRRSGNPPDGRRAGLRYEHPQRKNRPHGRRTGLRHDRGWREWLGFKIEARDRTVVSDHESHDGAYR